MHALPLSFLVLGLHYDTSYETEVVIKVNGIGTEPDRSLQDPRYSSNHFFFCAFESFEIPNVVYSSEATLKSLIIRG